MVLKGLELQIVELLQVDNSLNNKQIAEKLNKDTGNISRKMKQLVNKQVVNKKRISDGKITCNYYSLKDDIENLQVVEANCKKESSISSEDEYHAENINLRESFTPEPNEHISRASQYYDLDNVVNKRTLSCKHFLISGLSVSKRDKDYAFEITCYLIERYNLQNPLKHKYFDSSIITL